MGAVSQMEIKSHSMNRAQFLSSNKLQQYKNAAVNKRKSAITRKTNQGKNAVEVNKDMMKSYETTPETSHNQHKKNFNAVDTQSSPDKQKVSALIIKTQGITSATGANKPPLKIKRRSSRQQ